ncbi:type VII secretion integral membrane protein EccD [Paractinoplanes lichenicola]|uniref:Type VII secretion integral membrane protein EccD n=1 Tax=Paractinoplanes lichenicola TaxID=2802976 RepID=A0ABS1VEV1_9ACTN|nr:type VII secretion integral membrane protein EccD [Actinoplanes lichenicola]MBL7253222.1 type VII secretion integral membrane protein EccD [Actinoplanes lichenicola]
MTTAMDRQLCRITVIGPDRKIDLAVPSATPVAGLLPVLLQHTSSGRRLESDEPEGAWVLQRLGQTPFELTGTPESLDWLEGEELHLRRAEDPLPELDFDDVAEGIATTVNRRSDRWQPEYRRVLFLILSVVAMAVLAAVLTDRGPVLPQVITAGVLAAAFLTAALMYARKVPDGAFSLLFGFGAAAFAALSASRANDGDAAGITLAAATAVVAVATVLLIAQRTLTPHLPFPPMLVVAVTAAVVAGVLLMQRGSAMTVARTSAIAVAILLAVIVLAPRAAVKFARLRGPQLPKTGSDMAYDVEPAPSDVVHRRTDDADTYLTVALVASALVLPVLFHYAIGSPGWPGWTFVLVVSGAILLRARTFLGLWQRLALTAAGTVGLLMVIMRLSSMLTGGWRWVLLSGLLAMLLPLVLAAMRPWPRRMLPFWEYAATFLDVATGVAVLPILAQILGLYAWARGLFG